jgi:hypothetical protein
MYTCLLNFSGRSKIYYFVLLISFSREFGSLAGVSPIFITKSKS